MAAAMKGVIISYSCATPIQKTGAFWLLRRSLRREEVRLNLLVKVWGGTLGHSRYHTPMKLASKMTDDGKVVKHWELTEVVSSVYSLMCSMSNLISNQGQHAEYHLNESNRFGIRHELAFKLCVSWVAAMTYVSTVRLNDPDYDANLLLQNTYALNNRIYRAFVIALGVKYASIAALMRFVWHTEDFCSVHQRDATIDVYEKWVVKLHSLQEENLEGALKDLQGLFGEEKAASL
jgi:hypothetical protein